MLRPSPCTTLTTKESAPSYLYLTCQAGPWAILSHSLGSSLSWSTFALDCLSPHSATLSLPLRCQATERALYFNWPYSGAPRAILAYVSRAWCSTPRYCPWKQPTHFASSQSVPGYLYFLSQAFLSSAWTTSIILGGTLHSRLPSTPGCSATYCSVTL